MLANLKSLLESKSFVVGLLGSIAAAVAVFGYNVNVAAVLAVITPVELMVGAQGWGADAAKHAADAQVKCHMASIELAKLQRVPSFAEAKNLQAGFARIGVMLMIGAIAAMAALSTILVFNEGCADVKPVVTDVIDCAKAEAVTVSDGYSILQIAEAVYEAIAAGPAAVLAATENLISKYGPEIVACTIDNYPEPAPAPGPGSGSAVASASPAVLAKHAALQKFFAGKTINHNNYKKH